MRTLGACADPPVFVEITPLPLHVLHLHGNKRPCSIFLRITERPHCDRESEASDSILKGCPPLPAISWNKE